MASDPARNEGLQEMLQALPHNAAIEVVIHDGEGNEWGGIPDHVTYNAHTNTLSIEAT